MRLDRLLADRGMTLAELAERVGVTVVNLSVLRNGRARPVRFSTLSAICDVLNCQPGDVLTFESTGGHAEEVATASKEHLRPDRSLPQNVRVRSPGEGYDRVDGPTGGPLGGIRMGCLLVLGAAFAPRLVVVFAWIARPVYFGSVFDTWIFPLLGLLFLPFTTLMWLLVGGPPLGVHGLDWLWIVLALMLDLSHYGNTWEQRGTVEAGLGRGRSTPPPPM